jgi:hypothetical protein
MPKLGDLILPSSLSALEKKGFHEWQVHTGY